MPAEWLLYFFDATPCPAKSRRQSTAVSLGFQFALYRVALGLFPTQYNQPCFIIIYLCLADQIFRRSFVYQQQFCFPSLASFLLVRVVALVYSINKRWFRDKTDILDKSNRWNHSFHQVFIHSVDAGRLRSIDLVSITRYSLSCSK